MAIRGRQLGAMLWKNWLLKLRHPWLTIVEILLPVAIMLILMAIRSRVDFHTHPVSAHIKKGTFVEVGRSEMSPSLDQFLLLCAARDEHLAFVPDNEATAAMINILSLKYPLLQAVAKVYKDQAELDSYIKSKSYASVTTNKNGSVSSAGPKIKGAVVFFHQGPCSYDYSIRLNHSWAFQGFPDVTTIMDTTGSYVDDLQLGVSMTATYEYGFSGFLTLQQVIDSYIILMAQQQPSVCDHQSDYRRHRVSPRRLNANHTISAAFLPTDISTAPFPTREYTDDEFQSIVKNFLGVLYLLGFLYPVSRLISCSVLEKERGIKDGMNMMGLEDANFYMSWFITYTLQFAVSSIIVSLVTMNSVFAYSSITVVFTYFFLFGLSAITLCFLISTFFSRAKTATAVGTLSFLAAFFPYYVVDDTGVPLSIKLLASLLSPTAFALGSINFADYERAHVGVRWSNIWKESSGVIFLLCLVMMAFDTCLYAVMGWYFSRALRDECAHTVWGCIFGRLWKQELPTDNECSPDGETDENDSDTIEHVSSDLQQQERENRCVQIKNLRRVFQTSGRRLVAVDSLNLTLYEGQILALLGHNGAGKSTTIGMLVGSISPTSGDAQVLGRSISKDMVFIRNQLGVCPQHDILFPELTVKEHLELYWNLKSRNASGMQAEIDSMLSEVGLSDKGKTVVSHLSGGMKRKLSVAIALLGDSKVVILDEPTSGMDPYSMRSTWRLLKRSKKGRVILLTTHSMDEADILGDRIAIMGDGRLRCCGSSLFLKHKYGVGYTLTIVKGNSDAEKILGLVNRHLPSATVLSNVASELTFRLPLASTSSFQSLFAELERHTSSDPGELDGITDATPYKIESYGISVTTLEEVFLRVARGSGFPQKPAMWTSEGDITEEQADSSLEEAEEQEGFLKKPEPVDACRSEVYGSWYHWISAPVGFMSRVLTNMVAVFRRRPIIPLGKRRSFFGRHFKALVKKRALCATRDKKTIIFQLVVPAIFLFLGLLLLMIKPHPDQPSVTFTTSWFNPSVTGGGSGAPIPFNLTLPLAKQVAAHITGGSIQKQEYRAYRFPDPEITLKNAIEAAGVIRGPALVSMSEFLITSLNESYQSRYGAVVMEKQHIDGSVGYTVLHNSTCQHAAPTYINVMHNALLRLATGNHNVTIKTRNHPLPMTESQRAQRRDLNAFSAGIIVNIAYSFIPASFAVAIVKEREVRAKHQQLISGVSLMAYWISTYFWDVLSYLLPAGLAIGLFFAFGMEEYIGLESLPATSILMVAYGPAIAASTYCLTFFFSDHSVAQNAILLIHFFGGLILMVASFIMSLLRATKRTNSILKNIFRLSPGFCLADGLASLALRKQSLKPSSQKEPFDWNTTGASITYLWCEGVIYFLVVLGMELLPAPNVLASWFVSCIRRRRGKTFCLSPNSSSITEPLLSSYVLENEDEDVARERRRVYTGGCKDSLVRLIDLRKVYAGGVGEPAKVAVGSLTFAVDPGECFGFLGTNGAGKSTTLSMLCGELQATEGKAYVVGHDVCINPTDARQLIGYCPQFDALLDLLTVREHLELYANIKAVPEDRVSEVVDDKLSEFDLWENAHKTAASLSGGNRRKLSVAIAMIGNPPIVILDEPSTGMDPVARRFMWDVISRISTRRGLCAVILTTHSMAEAQALCTRIGIMAGGYLRCLGSPQHLKSRFGNSLELEVKAVAVSQVEVDKLCSTLLQSLPSTATDAESRPCQGLDCMLSEAEIDAAASVLGNEQWGQTLLSAGPSSSDGVLGELIANELARDGKLHIGVFCEWWLARDRASRIDSFIRASFPGACLLERNGPSFRYRLPYKSSSLARVFGHMEENRAAVGISQYNVGQATLEAIFNGFASSQQ